MTTTMETFASFDPATGKELARYPIHDAEHVRAAVERAGAPDDPTRHLRVRPPAVPGR